MNKKTFYISVIAILAISAPIFFLLQNKSSSKGAVLGSSVNSFYSKKAIRTYQPPRKNDGVKDPFVYADYIVLIEDSSKYPLYQKQSSESVPIASMTKVMTAMVALDIYKLADVVKVPEEATKISGSKIELQENESITVENLLYGLLMNSGNDAAEAFAASKVSRDDFIKLMNEKAADIGMKNTQFVDPAGLEDTGHSTAFDMAILFSYAIKNQTFRTVVGTAEKEIYSTDGTVVHKLKNTNRLTTSEIPFDGVIGGKTGFTPDAGHALVCAAQKNGVTLISVIIKTASSANSASAEETSKLLSWGFDSYTFPTN